MKECLRMHAFPVPWMYATGDGFHGHRWIPYNPYLPSMNSVLVKQFSVKYTHRIWNNIFNLLSTDINVNFVFPTVDSSTFPYHVFYKMLSHNVTFISFDEKYLSSGLVALTCGDASPCHGDDLFTLGLLNEAHYSFKWDFFQQLFWFGFFTGEERSHGTLHQGGQPLCCYHGNDTPQKETQGYKLEVSNLKKILAYIWNIKAAELKLLIIP